MLADHIRNLFFFNTWAWDRVFASVNKLDRSAAQAPRLLFEKTIHATLVHCLAAEYIWLERCSGRSPEAMFGPEDFSDVEAVQKRWAAIATGWRVFLADLQEEDFLQDTSYKNTRGMQFVLPLKDICQHVINHATEHRSQLTPILYFEGLPTKPLDYAFYVIDI